MSLKGLELSHYPPTGREVNAVLIAVTLLPTNTAKDDVKLRVL